MKQFLMMGFIMGVLAFSQTVFAQDDYTFSYSVINYKGKQTLELTVTAIDAGRVLGVTFYPLEMKDVAKEAFSTFVAVKKGTNTVEIPVDPKYKGGTFEAALWTKTTQKSECLKTDAVCQRVGFRAGGYSTSYMWGYLYAP
jgi:hypothetical protein